MYRHAAKKIIQTKPAEKNILHRFVKKANSYDTIKISRWFHVSIGLASYIAINEYMSADNYESYQPTKPYKIHDPRMYSPFFDDDD